MRITKRDLVTIVVLSLGFFLIASWALGRLSVPTTTWESTGGEIFYVDLGSVRNVSDACVLLKQGTLSVVVYSGSPGAWEIQTSKWTENYYQWILIPINNETEFIRFVFQASHAEIAEISALDADSQKIIINGIKAEKNSDDKALLALIDEQESVECPPTYQSETYFDEIYYVRTAQDYLNLREPYEWTHPPLGKLILAGGIYLFGDSPFGWRITGVMFAAAMIPLIYLFGKKMFGTWIGAVAPSFLLMFDFMHFTMARIATIDTFVVFFSLLSTFFFFVYLQNLLSQGWKASTLPLFFAILFFALGFSTKWYVLYGFAGQLCILLVLRIKDLSSFKGGIAKTRAFLGRPFLRLVVFIGFAAGVYLLTFIPYMVIGHTLADVYQTQWAMFNYHSTLTATHPFSSQWWTWPLMSRPVWFYVSQLSANTVSTIVDMGNPAVWWVGFASVLLVIEEGIRKRDRVCLFLATIFLFQWLPYAFISRTLFLYHFYFEVPLLVLATAFVINRSWGTRRGKLLVGAYFVLVVVLFAVFYPAISGIPVSVYWRDGLRWFRSWAF